MAENTSFGPVTPYYDTLMAGVPYAFWASYLERLWTRHQQSPRVILDLACGTGTMTRLLAARGYQATGVDLSEGMLEVARRKASDAEMALAFYPQDAAELDLGAQQFDSVICLFDSLNYLLEPGRLQEAFRRVFAHLNPGGSFVFDVNTEYALANGMFNQSCTRRDEALHYRWRSQYNPDSRICTVRMKFEFDPGDGVRQEFTEVHRQRGYSKDELAQWLREAGFTEVSVYDGYTTEAPKKRSDRLFYFAVKPR